MKTTNLSRRKFKIVGIDTTETIEADYNALQLFQDDGTELTYSLQEDIDRILDLKEGQAIYIRLSRDNSENLGVLKRIK